MDLHVSTIQKLLIKQEIKGDQNAKNVRNGVEYVGRWECAF